MEQANKLGTVINLPIHNIELPEELNLAVDVEILQWLVSGNISQAIVDSIARCRVHVVRKPRCKAERYIVVGGIIPYVILLRNTWLDSVHVVLVEEPTSNLPKLINDDLMLWLLAFKAGAIASGGRATLLTSLMRRREETGQPAGLVLNSRQLGKGGILKEITGFDSRGFRREKIDPVPPILEKICIALGMRHDAVALNGEEKEEL